MVSRYPENYPITSRVRRCASLCSYGRFGMVLAGSDAHLTGATFTESKLITRAQIPARVSREAIARSYYKPNVQIRQGAESLPSY
jgi:hypothetical protein